MDVCTVDQHTRNGNNLLEGGLSLWWPFTHEKPASHTAHAIHSDQGLLLAKIVSPCGGMLR